jgi:hypothetical protein
LTSLLTHPYTL